MIPASLLVASACTGAIPGISSRAGSCTSPPPPTTASTQPATNPARTRRTTVPVAISMPETVTRCGRRAGSALEGVVLGLGRDVVVDVEPQVTEQRLQHAQDARGALAPRGEVGELPPPQGLERLAG